MMPKTSLSIHMNEWALWKDTGSIVENQVLLLKKKKKFFCNNPKRALFISESLFLLSFFLSLSLS